MMSSILGQATTEGNMVRGAQPPAKPTLHMSLPETTTSAATSLETAKQALTYNRTFTKRTKGAEQNVLFDYVRLETEAKTEQTDVEETVAVENLVLLVVLVLLLLFSLLSQAANQ